MARKRRNQEQEARRSSVSRGRKLHDLQDSETEEELRRFLQNGSDFDSADEQEDDAVEEGKGHRPYRIDQPESFGTLGQFWTAES